MSIPEELRTAAARLREAANGTTPGTWDVLPSGELVTWQETGDEVGEEYEYLIDMAWDNPADPKWAGLVNPLLAPLLAALLETEAFMCEKRGNSIEGSTFHAVQVARFINGTPASRPQGVDAAEESTPHKIAEEIS